MILKSNESLKVFDFDDIYIVPNFPSTIESRDHVSTYIERESFWANLPLIPSPMTDVVGIESGAIFINNGLPAIVPRFNSEEIQFNMINTIKSRAQDEEAARLVGIAISANISEDFNRALRFFREGGRLFCIDTANGFHIKMEEIFGEFGKLKKEYKEPMYIISGNVASSDGFSYLSSLYRKYNLNGGIRVGIGGGSVCTTKTQTGIHLPTATSIVDCANYAKINKNIDLIADGGIRTPSDFCKALYLGADFVMAGGIFAKSYESPGVNNNKVKYRGAASFEIQSQFKDKANIKYVEGIETENEVEGHLEDVINKFKYGLKSSLAYLNYTDVLMTLNQIKE